MIRRLSRRPLLLTAAIGVLLAAGLAGPAQAQAANPAAATASVTLAAPAGPEGDFETMATCPSGYACFWRDPYFGGPSGMVAGNNPDFRVFKQSGCPLGSWHECISSIRNDGESCTVFFWTGVGYTGRWHSLARGDQVGKFSEAPYKDPAFDNAISSNHWCKPN
jgi:peptidase inhibitor family I36